MIGMRRIAGPKFVSTHIHWSIMTSTYFAFVELDPWCCEFFCRNLTMVLVKTNGLIPIYLRYL